MDWKTKKLEDGREYHKSEMGRYRSTVYDRKGAGETGGSAVGKGGGKGRAAKTY